MADQLTSGPVPHWPGTPVPLGAGEVFVRSAAVDAPDAEPAVFVHGLGGSSRNWTDLMAELSRPGPVPAEPVLDSQAIDLPGFGYSPPPADGDYSIDAHAAAVIALIDGSGRWPVHLIGNSLGGAICVRVAARRPDLVRTLTLISPALPDLRPRPGPLRVGLVALPGVGPWLLGKVLAAPAEQRTAATIGDLYADPSRIHPDRFRDEVAEVNRRDTLDYQSEAFTRSTRSIVTEYLRFGPRRLWRDAARIPAPALAIYGSHDHLVSPVMAARAARAFRSASAVVLPQTGHVAMMERPATVARLIREFIALAQSPARPGSGSGGSGSGRSVLASSASSGSVSSGAALSGSVPAGSASAGSGPAGAGPDGPGHLESLPQLP
jgi:pimeloyl-ACP methyl ester carboxylesterase